MPAKQQWASSINMHKWTCSVLCRIHFCLKISDLETGTGMWCTGNFDSQASHKTRAVVRGTRGSVPCEDSFLFPLARLLLCARDFSSCFDFFVGISQVWIYSTLEWFYFTYFCKNTTDFSFFLPQACLLRNPYACFQGLSFLLPKVCLSVQNKLLCITTSFCSTFKKKFIFCFKCC